MKKTENKFMKYFTIFLIIVFLLGVVGTGVIAILPQNNSNTVSSKN